MNNIKKTGENVFIAENAVMTRPHLIELGNHVALDHGFYCTTNLKIGDYVHIAPYTTIIGGEAAYCKIGNFCSAAAGCRIICGSDEHLGSGLVGPTIPKKFKDKIIYEPVIFEDFVNIATNVVIAPGVTLAEGTVVGANSFVNKDTEKWTIYVGNPAKPIKKRDEKIMKEYARELGYDVK